MALILSCSDGGGGDVQEPPAVAAVAVIGPSSLPAGETAQLDATARDAEGEEVEAASFRWETSDPAVATVSETGFLSALAAGEVEVRAVADGVAGTLTLTITTPAPPPPATVTVVVTGPATELRPGETLQLTASARDASGAELDRSFTWSSGSESVAVVSAEGLVTGIAPGDVEILASTDGISGSLAIRVLPPVGSVSVGLEQVAAGLNRPLYLTSPVDDPRLFIVEQRGTIRIVRDGVLLTTPFLNLSDQVSSGSEQGLLGLAFPRDYATSGRFVVHYTDRAGDTRLSLFSVSGDPDRADPESESVVLSVDQPFTNHNGGQVVFGPDGYLYLGLGDGGSSGGNDAGRGQSLGDLLGAVLRIDVSGAAGYRVPPDNPFVGTAGARPEVWSYGLRNPWRFSFDREGGDLYIADVGERAWEEINYAGATSGSGRGRNYGWSLMEGSACFADTPCDPAGLELPITAYGHDQGCSIIGGYVYRGAAVPQLQGHYLYSDFCAGWVRSIRVEGGSVVEQRDWPELRPGGQVLSLGEDAAGELYLLAQDGGVFRIVPR